MESLISPSLPLVFSGILMCGRYMSDYYLGWALIVLTGFFHGLLSLQANMLKQATTGSLQILSTLLIVNYPTICGFLSHL
jgi:hypothetical protein